MHSKTDFELKSNALKCGHSSYVSDPRNPGITHVKMCNKPAVCVEQVIRPGLGIPHCAEHRMYQDVPYTKKVHFISTDDWVRMYVDNELTLEGHSLNDTTIAEILIGRGNVTSEYFEGDGSGDDYYDFCDEWEEQQKGKGKIP